MKIFYFLASSVTVVCGGFCFEGGWKCWVTGHRKPTKLFKLFFTCFVFMAALFLQYVFALSLRLLLNLENI